MLTGAPLSSEQEDNLRFSTVVHRSLDEYKARLAASAKDGHSADQDDHDLKEDDDNNTAPPSESNPTGEVYAQPDGDEDRVLKNTRPAKPEDGLLSIDELKAMYARYGKGAYSLYGTNYGRLERETGNWYGEREGKPPSREGLEQRIQEGYYEPAWTNGEPDPPLIIPEREVC